MITEIVMILMLNGADRPIEIEMSGMTACRQALYMATKIDKTASSGFCLDKESGRSLNWKDIVE